MAVLVLWCSTSSEMKNTTNKKYRLKQGFGAICCCEWCHHQVNPARPQHAIWTSGKQHETGIACDLQSSGTEVMWSSFLQNFIDPSWLYPSISLRYSEQHPWFCPCFIFTTIV